MANKAMHRTTCWEGLEWLIDAPLVIADGIYFKDECMPADVRIVAVYPHTVLLKLTWVYSTWYGCDMEPRYTHQLVRKADLMTGAVKLVTRDTRIPITGDMISKYRPVRAEGKMKDSVDILSLI